MLLAVLGPLVYWYGPAVFRIVTNKGELVIETDDPDVEVRVKRNGEQVTLVDTKSNKEITLQAGTYQLELAGDKDGLALSTNQFTLSRGGREVVKVRLEEVIHVGEIRRFEGHTNWVCRCFASVRMAAASLPAAPMVRCGRGISRPESNFRSSEGTSGQPFGALPFPTTETSPSLPGRTGLSGRGICRRARKFAVIRSTPPMSL